MSQPAFDFGDDELDDGANPTYTVGELAEAINSSIQRSFGDGIWVRGEITGWSDRGNHAYFTLADDALVGERNGAVINVQFFAPRAHAPAADAAEAPPPAGRRHEGARVRLPRLLRPHRSHRPEDDRHRSEVHARRHRPDPRRDRPSPGRRRPARRRTVVAACPPVPLRIGAVTSVGTAAWHDFLHELESSGLGFQLSVVDVQGAGRVRRRPSGGRDRARSPGSPTSTPSWSSAAADAETSWPCSTPSHRPHHRRAARCRCSPGSATRSTAASPTRWRTRRSRPPPRAPVVDRPCRRLQGRHRDGVELDLRRADATLGASTNELSASAHRIARRTHAAVERADERLAMRIERLGRVGPAATQHADVRLTSAPRARRTLAAAIGHASGRLDVVAARIASLDPCRPGGTRLVRSPGAPTAHRPFGRRSRARRRARHPRRRRFDPQHRERRRPHRFSHRDPCHRDSIAMPNDTAPPTLSRATPPRSPNSIPSSPSSRAATSTSTISPSRSPGRPS